MGQRRNNHSSIQKLLKLTLLSMPRKLQRLLSQKFAQMRLLDSLELLKFLLALTLPTQKKFILLILRFARAEPHSIILTNLLIQYIVQPRLLTAHLLDGAATNGSQLQKKNQQSQESAATMPRDNGLCRKTLEVTEVLL